MHRSCADVDVSFRVYVKMYCAPSDLATENLYSGDFDDAMLRVKEVSKDLGIYLVNRRAL